MGYVEHPANMLLTDERDVTRELDLVDSKHRAARRREGVELDRATFLHWVAWGHLRRRRRLRAAGVYLRSGWENRRPRDLALAAAFALRAVVPLASGRRLLHVVAPPSAVGSTTQPAAPSWLTRWG